MITRYAIFEGHISAERQGDFQHAVLQKLVPAVRQLPSVQSVSVSFSNERDPGAPEIAMLLITTYPDIVSLRRALDTPERQHAQDVTEAIFDEFGHCRIHHHLATTYGPN
ncbi:MAG: hypothetical protein AAGG56_02185 [Pseudomonadota bacterium]